MHPPADQRAELRSFQPLPLGMFLDGPIGPCVSKAFMEGEGGFLFFKQRYRMTMNISDYELPASVASKT